MKDSTPVLFFFLSLLLPFLIPFAPLPLRPFLSPHFPRAKLGIKQDGVVVVLMLSVTVPRPSATDDG